jgi:hypothetical protein
VRRYPDGGLPHRQPGELGRACPGSSGLRTDGTLTIEYPYFEREDPLILEEAGTYVATDVAFQHNVTHSWNHGLGEIITALMDAGLRLTALTEHDSIPWQAFPGRMEQIGGGEWRLADRPWRLVHSYTLQAVKQD